jgi:hypothetical protein
MGRWVIAFIAGVALVVVPSATSEVVVARTVFHSAALRAEAVTGFTATCPPGYFALSAGVYSPAAGVTTLAVRPLGLRSYGFRFGNPATNPGRHVTAAVACRKVRPGAGTTPYFRLTVLRSKPLLLRPQSRRSNSIACPRGTVPAGAGYDLDPVREKANERFSRIAVSVRRFTRSIHGFSFVLRNDASKAHTAVVYGTCVTLVRPPRAADESLHIRILTASAELKAGSHVLRQACPRRWTAVAVGYALPSGVSVDGAVALATTGRWSVRSEAGGRAPADFQLVCGRLGPS